MQGNSYMKLGKTWNERPHDDEDLKMFNSWGFG